MEEKFDIKELIIRFLEKGLSNDETILLMDWIYDSPENRKVFDHYNEIWQLSDVVFNKGYYNTDAGWESLHQKIKDQNQLESNNIRLIKGSRLILWKIISVAALLVAGLFITLFIEKKDVVVPKLQTVTIQSPRGQKTRVILADSSVVWLNSESQLTYSNDFDGNQRLVSLTGEGYFQVKKDSNRPFVVRTLNADVKVFGTRFNVCAYPDEQEMEATLEEGKISVNITGKSNQVAVAPGERMVLDRQSGEVSLKNVDTQLYTSWKDNKLRFDDAVFADVVKKLERWYDVKIIVDKDLKYTERYTMCIKTESLREVLKGLMLTTPMSYKIEEEKVFIYPKK